MVIEDPEEVFDWFDYNGFDLVVWRVMHNTTPLLVEMERYKIVHDPVTFKPILTFYLHSLPEHETPYELVHWQEFARRKYS